MMELVGVLAAGIVMALLVGTLDVVVGIWIASEIECKRVDGIFTIH
jgi:hypothetical protein